MAFVLIDLTKFAAQTDFGQLPGVREKWCYAIKNMWRMSDSDIPAADTAFRELYDECKLSKLSDMEKEEYEKSILEYDDVKDAIHRVSTLYFHRTRNVTVCCRGTPWHAPTYR